MKKIWASFKSEIKTNIIIMVVSLLVGFAFFALYVWVWHKTFSISHCADACTIVFIILFSFSILTLLTRWGTYDSLSYGFYQLGHFMFNSKRDKKYTDLIDYKEQKMAQREIKGHYYLSFLFVSLVFLMATIVFLIIFNVGL